MLPAIAGAAVAIGSKIIGNVLDGNKDQKQLEQQQKLQDQQISGAKELADYNQLNQLKTWNETNYEAQMQHLQNAGLNPALIYENGGAGGSTGASTVALPTGGQASDEASRTNADTNQTATGQAMAMMLGQQQVMETQAEKNKADANLSNVQANKLEGVDTTKTATETESIAQGIENQKAAQQLTNAQTQLTSALATIQGGSINDQLTRIQQESIKAQGEAESALAQGQVDQKTVTAKINLLNQTATNAAIQAIAIQQGIQLDQAKIQEITQGIQQKWQELTISATKTSLEHSDRLTAINEYTSNALKVAGINAAGNIVNNVVSIATKTPPLKGEVTHTSKWEGGSSSSTTYEH